MTGENEHAMLLKETGLQMLQKMYFVDATPPESEEKIAGDVESKYRKRWWFAKVLLSFDFLFPFISDQSLKDKINKAREKWTDDEFTKRVRPTLKEDIMYADGLIVEVATYFGLPLSKE